MKMAHLSELSLSFFGMPLSRQWTFRSETPAVALVLLEYPREVNKECTWDAERFPKKRIDKPFG